MQESNIAEFIQDIDGNQLIDEIQIESDDDNIVMKGVKFNQVMDKVQQILTEQEQSRFYKSRAVHFAAKSKVNVNYLEQHYTKQLEVLKLSLEEQKEYLKNIVQAQSQDELEMRETEHRLNREYIKKKEMEVKYQDFVPCIYIKGEKKKPIFGTVTQQFSRKGVGNFMVKLGYRYPFLKYDTLQFNFQWPISNLRRKYYQIGLDWSNPIKDWGTAHFKMNSAKQPTFKNIDTQLSSIGWSIYKGSSRYQIQYGNRSPFVHENIEKSLKKDFYLPSTKFSFKYSHIFQNSIKFQDITMGKYSQLKTQLALPVMGDSNFIKCEYNFRKFYDTFKARNWIQNQHLRKFFWKSTIQTNFSASGIYEFGQKKYVNDTLEGLEVRGFQSYRRPVSSYANIKGSLKFNIHNYPLIQDARIVTFLYSQIGLSFLKEQPLKPMKMASTGLGLSFYAGPFTQIQLLCNLAQWQSYQSRQPVNFQIRFGVFD